MQRTSLAGGTPQAAAPRRRDRAPAATPGTPGGTDAASRISQVRAWLDAIADIARSVNQALPLDDLLDLIAETVCRLMGYDFCALLLPDPAGRYLIIEGAHGLSAGYLASINEERPIGLGPGPQGEGPTSRAFASRRPVSVWDIRLDPTFVPWAGPAVQQGYRSVLCVPLVATGRALGVLNCYTRTLHEFSADETTLVETIANQAAVAIEAAGLRARERATIQHLEELNRALEEHRAMLERAEEIHRQLTRAALAGSGLQEIVDALVLLLDATVLVEDSAGDILAAGPRETAADRDPRHLLEHQPAVRKAVADLDAGGRAGALPPLEGGARRSGFGSMAPIVVGAEQVGRVWALGASRAPGPLELRALEHGAVMAAFELLKQRAERDVEWRLSGDLLNELLTSDRLDLPALTARARQLGHNLGLRHELFLVRPDDIEQPAEDGGGDVPDRAGSAGRRLLELVQRVTSSHWSGRPLVSGRGDHLALLASRPAPSGVSAPQLADAIRREAPLALGGVSVTAIAGGACLPLADLRSTYRAARGILDLAARTGARDRVLALDDFGMFRLLLQVENTDELVRFARSVLVPLQQHDRRRTSELARTLRAYLEHGCRPGETSESLVIHPNTLTYRLHRIEDLTGLELHRPDALLKAQLAVLIQDLVGLG